MGHESQAISPSDLEQARDIFDAAEIPHARIRFSYNEGSDRWELRDAADDSVVARRAAPPNSVPWVAV
jgi:hypothetical protein